MENLSWASILSSAPVSNAAHAALHGLSLLTRTLCMELISGRPDCTLIGITLGPAIAPAGLLTLPPLACAYHLWCIITLLQARLGSRCHAVTNAQLAQVLLQTTWLILLEQRLHQQGL